LRKRTHERHRCLYTDNITMHHGDVYSKMDPAGPGQRKLRPTVNSTIQLLRHKSGEHFDDLSKTGVGKIGGQRPLRTPRRVGENK
jgi:hypothetical protein